MTATIQIRNVPASLHRKLKVRAELAGMSLSDYLLKEISHIAEQPTSDALRKRMATRSSVTLATSPARAIREQRGN